MKYHIIPIILMLGFFVGCRSDELPKASRNHPAHPEAATAQWAEQGGMLEVDESELPHRPAEMQESGHGMSHH